MIQRLHLILLTCIMTLCSLRAEEGPSTLRWPELPVPLQKEEIFGLRFRQVLEKKGAVKARAFLEKELARNPAPHVKAYIAIISFFGPAWGMGPETNYERGYALAKEAFAEGSIVAADALGRAYGHRLGGQGSDKESIDMLERAAAGGVTRSMVRLARFKHLGAGCKKDPTGADMLLKRAAVLGSSYGYVELGELHEKGELTGTPNMLKAAKYYTLAVQYGDFGGLENLTRMEKNGFSAARRYRLISRIHLAQMVGWLPPSVVTRELKELEADHGDDHLALVELGRAYLYGEYLKKDHDRALTYLKRAANCGIEDAQQLLAEMKLKGFGMPKDVQGALAELRALSKEGVSAASAYLGFLHYWKAAEAPGIEKSKHLAYEYSRLAAEQGSLVGLMNLICCYEFGIGVDTNYAVAARLSQILYYRGMRLAKEKAWNLLSHAQGHE